MASTDTDTASMRGRVGGGIDPLESCGGAATVDVRCDMMSSLRAGSNRRAVVNERVMRCRGSEPPAPSHAESPARSRREDQGRTATMNDHRKADRPVVPAKSPNDAGQPVTERVEGGGLAKGTRGSARHARARATRCVVTGRATAEWDRSKNRGFKEAAHRLDPPPRSECAETPTLTEDRPDRPGSAPCMGKGRASTRVTQRDGANLQTHRALGSSGRVTAGVARSPQRCTLKWIVSF